MKEKDIENLVTKYPDEFFGDKKLGLSGQQVNIGKLFADIIFEDEEGNKIIVEIKRGILKRDAIGQLMEYYGEYKSSHKEDNIKLVLVANVIPTRIKTSMEYFGIETKEISMQKLKDVAEKHGYIFEESVSKEEIEGYRQQFDDIKSRKPKIWIFQANPDIYDIQNCLRDKDIIKDIDVWEVNQYENDIKKGDIGIIWMSGKEAGIYGVIEVVDNPETINDSNFISSKYWVDENRKNRETLRVKFIYKINLIDNPIMKEEIKKISELSNLSILKFSQGTNFLVKEEEWKIISELIEKRLS